jgi:hypothetical protein
MIGKRFQRRHIGATDADAVEEAMQAYLDWELGLVAQVKKDGCATFRRFDQ